MGASTMQMEKISKLKYIDALRGIAICGVLVVHCVQVGRNNYSSVLENIILNGAIGVQLFYVVSAFTIFLTFTDHHEKEKNYITNFFIRRFFRIAPMYYLGIVYYLFQDGWGPRYWLGDAAEVSGWNILANLSFVHSFNPYWITSVVPGGWSIAVEMFFYCLVPFLFMKIKNLNQAILFFEVAIVLRMALQSFFHQFPLIAFDRLWDEYLFFYPPNQLPVFACGIILYFLVYTPRAKWRVQPIVVFTFAIMLLVQLGTHTRFVFPVHIQFGMAFIILGYALSLKEFYVLVNPITIYFGKISYSMYMVHFAILYGLTRFDYVDWVPTNTVALSIINYGLRFACLVSLTVLISTIFYRWIEVPFRNMGRRIIQRRENAQRTAVGLPTIVLGE
jgi:peptidoglycan/LPS O-acetylase OafA/YrhL